MRRPPAPLCCDPVLPLVACAFGDSRFKSVDIMIEQLHDLPPAAYSVDFMPSLVVASILFLLNINVSTSSS